MDEKLQLKSSLTKVDANTIRMEIPVPATTKVMEYNIEHEKEKLDSLQQEYDLKQKQQETLLTRIEEQTALLESFNI